MNPARITSFLVKLASRCNLDCDYCYVYHHADQGWRDLPRLLSDANLDAFAARLAEYTRSTGIERLTVIYHGGEPLLAGASHIVEATRRIRSTVDHAIAIDFGLQTNGLLLDDGTLDAFEAERIAVSLSMDGPRSAHDLHRTTRKGRSSFDRVEAALARLEQRPSIFAGVIAVVDASVSGETLLEYFSQRQIPKLDFLLPDSHHNRPPPGRAQDPDLYVRWLTDAFDAWLDRYPQVGVRTFEALLDAAAGLPSGTDAFGLGDVSLITVETDGSWHDLDVLKVAGNGATRLIGAVEDTPIASVAASAALTAHRRLLTRDGLSEVCRSCDVVEACGGGSVPHRFRNGSFDNPSVYCRELKAVIAHARSRLLESLVAHASAAGQATGFDIGHYETAETSRAIVSKLHREALDENLAGLQAALAATGDATNATDDLPLLRSAARRAGTVAWQRAMRAAGEGVTVRDVAGHPIEVDPSYAEQLLEAARSGEELEVGLRDPWLRLPFGREIEFQDDQVAEVGRGLVREALDIIDNWRPALGRELRLICSAIQFIRDPNAHPDKIVSFSDDSVPGALFVSVRQSGGYVDAYDLADSLIHEYRHQKLYLLERRHPTTHAAALVRSPWREELRPVSGLLHAAFVFVELKRFWEHVRTSGPSRLHNRALTQIDDTERNLCQAFATLRSCDLTPAGRALAELLESRSRQPAFAA